MTIVAVRGRSGHGSYLDVNHNNLAGDATQTLGGRGNNDVHVGAGPSAPA